MAYDCKINVTIRQGHFDFLSVAVIISFTIFAIWGSNEGKPKLVSSAF